MEDEEYGDGQPETTDPMQTGAGPLAVLATLGNQYTSKEAYELSKRAYEKLQKEQTDITLEEDEVSEEMRQTAEEAKAQLRQARDRLLARKADESEKWFRLAEGLGKPTRSGTFGEVVGNVAEGQREYRTNRRKFLDEQEEGALGYGQDINKIELALQERRRLIAKVRREANARLQEQTLRNIAKEVRPTGGGSGNSSMSIFGKIARDQGFIPGTPEFAAQVTKLEAIDSENRRATAGTDAPGETAGDAIIKENTSREWGVPVSIMDPYQGMSTKQRNAAMSLEQRATEERLKDLAKIESDATSGVSQMNRFLNLNKRASTGWFRGQLPALADAEQQMDAISAEVSRKMKQPGEGSVSDFDAKMFLAGTVGRNKTYLANLGIATAYKIMRRNEIDRIHFLREYAALNNHLRGADVEWQNYLEANPIFDPKSPGEAKLNKNRVRYKTYFRSMMKEPEEEPFEGDEGQVGPADDHLPGHFPGEDTIVKARGGRVYARGGRTKKPEELPDIAAEHEGAEELPDVYAGPTDEDVSGIPEELPDVQSVDENDGSGDLRDALYAALQGFTVGTADEMRATTDPEGAAQDRAEYSDYAAQNPWKKAAALATGFAPLAALVPGAGLGAAALTGALTGGAFGATGGDDTRGSDALWGAAQGAVAAPATALATRYAYNQAGRLYDKVTGKTLSTAEEKLVLAANKDNIDLSQVASDLRASDRMGVPEGVGDAGGRRTRALIERAATRGGPESERFLEGEAAKQDGSYSRVEGQINKGMAPSEYFGEFEKLNKELYSASKPMYEAAYKKHPGIRSQEFMDLMDTKDGKAAFNYAKRLMDLDKKAIGKANIAGIVQKPSLEFLDYFKRGLDQHIRTIEADGPNTLGHSLREAKGRLVKELDAAAPEYKKARENYAGDLEMRDALKMGREDFAKLQPEEIRKKVAGMTWAEKDVFKSGVSQHLFEILGKPSSDFNAARRLLGSTSMRAKLEATFDDPKKWKIFEAAMDKEAEIYDRTHKMTARVEGKKAQALGKEESILSGVLDQGMSNVPGMGGISWTNRVYNWLRFPMPMSEATADGILKAINRGDVKAFDATMKRLSQAQPRLKIRGKRAGKVGMLLGILGAAAAAQNTPPGEKAKMEDQ